MLIANQEEGVVQRISTQILRTRPDQNGTGIFYHTDLRRQVLVPLDGNWENMRYNLAAAGLSSNIGSEFSVIPPGMGVVHLYSIIGTVPEGTPPIKVSTVEGDVTNIDPSGLVCTFEILEPDLRLLQEQNQMTLLLSANAIVQYNAQDYGTGVTEEGRERDILRGSLWAVPINYIIEVSRTEARSAAGSVEEIHQILEWAKERNNKRAMAARSQSFADRAERDDRRARGPMPPRRGTNTSVQPYGGTHFGKGTEGVPYHR